MSDVKRILEIMGYEIGRPINEQKKIIVESYLRTFTDDMSKLLIKVFDDADSYIQTLRATNQPTGGLSKIAELKDKLDAWTKTANKGFDEQIQILKKEIDEAGVGVGKLSDDEARKWDKLLNDSWTDFLKYVDDLVTANERLSWWGKFNDESGRALRAIKRIDDPNFDFRALPTTELERLRNNVDELVKFFDSYNPTYPYGRLKGDMITELRRVKRKLVKPLSELGWAQTFWEDTYSRWAGSEVEFFMQNLVKWKDKWFKGNQKLYSELMSLEDEIKKIYKETSSVPESKLARASAIIFTLKADKTVAMEDLLDMLVSQGVITKEFRDQITTSERFIDWMERGKKYIIQDASGSGRVKAYPITTAAVEEAYTAFRVLYGTNFILPLIKNAISRGEGKGYFKAVIEDIKDSYSRLLSYLFTQSTRLPSEVVILRNTLGVSKTTLLANAVSERITSGIMIPFWTSVVMLIYEAFTEMREVVSGEELHEWGKDWPEGYDWLDWFFDGLLKQGFGEFIPKFKDDMDNHSSIWGFWWKIDELVDIALNGNNEDLRQMSARLQAELIERLRVANEKVRNLDLKTQVPAELERLKAEFEDLKRRCQEGEVTGCDRVDETLARINEELGRNQNDENQNNDDNQNRGVTPPVDPNPAPVITGLEQEMKTAFEGWRQQGNSDSQWDSFSNNTGYVMVKGNKVEIKRLGNGTIALMLPTPVKIN